MNRIGGSTSLRKKSYAKNVSLVLVVEELVSG
jgi:hypothetical protein